MFVFILTISHYYRIVYGGIRMLSPLEKQIKDYPKSRDYGSLPANGGQ